MNFTAEQNDVDYVDDMREVFAIRTTTIINELQTMIEKTKRIENLVRSQMGLPMTIETVIDSAYNVLQSMQATSSSRDPFSPPPKKRTKYE